MPRIAGIDIPGNKRVPYALRYIYGIGLTTGQQICERLQINEFRKADDLSAEEIAEITRLLQDEYTIEGDLRREQQANVRRLISIGTYRGSRHKFGLPVHGQRTKTNARTRKGSKRTVGAVRGKEARSAAKAAMR